MFHFFVSICSGVTLNNNLNSQLNNNAILSAINNNSINNNQVKDLREEPITQDQPDPDYIKMFVGQVPRSMDEAQLKEMFEEFGRVHQINVLRDKVTGLSKGKLKVLLHNWLVKVGTSSEILCYHDKVFFDSLS